MTYETGTGRLKVTAYTARKARAVPGARVTVTLESGEVLTAAADEGGNAGPFEVPCPPRALSLAQNSAQRPYAVCTVAVGAPGFSSARTVGAQVFDGVLSLMEFELIPAGTGLARSESVYEVPAHALFEGDAGSGPAPAAACAAAPAVLIQPVVPKTITVHLGRPAASARDVTVSFRDYIKNVASSEVYPTWPEESLRANIHAQISLAMNRIYTEWYKSKGYAFDITNSTSYDQYYVHGRDIFEPMSRITDEIFDTYARKEGTVNPYYTEYCDGKSVTCPGMKQWGTKTLAEQGKNALQILRYYYGADLELVRTDNIADVPESYPGAPLRTGSTGSAVRTIQRQLNRIAQDYPFFGRLAVDGTFGEDTAEVVKKFQTQFDLSPDGVVGRATWYKISYIYVSVKDLAELTSEGERPSGSLEAGVYPGRALRLGSRGDDVQQVQFWLSELAQFAPAIPAPAVDGVFGAGTQRAVTAFQTQYGLAADGVVGRATWEKLYAEYVLLENDTRPPDADGTGPGAYPGTALRQGSRGDAVRRVQFWLRIADGAALAVDGVFGPATAAAVTTFQTQYGLAADGVVGRATWEKLYEAYTDVTSGLLAPGERPGQYPGTPLREGSRGAAVKEVQYYLYLLGAYYPEIPALAVDGVFGRATAAAVRAWQQLAGLAVDGVVGRATWDSIYAQFQRLRRVDGPLAALRRLAWPGYVLRRGQDGTAVRLLQFMLAFTGFFCDEVLPVGPADGVFGEETQRSLESFQRLAGLAVTGEAGEKTWNALAAACLALAAAAPAKGAAGEYPGFVLAQGSAGAAVLALQQRMNAIAARFCAAPFVPETGVFGEETLAAVRDFQQGFGLPVTGFVDRATWDAIFNYVAMEG